MGVVVDAENGVETGAFFRTEAWHMLGTVFTEEVTDYRKMLKLAHLDGWDVRHREIQTDARTDKPAFEVIRTSPHDGGIDRLGITGERYRIVSNEDAFAWTQAGHDGARWETAGAMDGGRTVFGSLAFERETVLDPNGVADIVKTFLLVSNSHDGSTAVQGGVTPTRVVCRNTLNIALGNVKQSFKFRHTATIADRMKAWALAVASTHLYMDAFDVEVNALFKAKVNKTKFFNEVVPVLYPKPEKDVKGSVTKWDNRIERLATIWNGETNQGVKGTAWGAFNVLTEDNQWNRQVRKGSVERFAAAGAGFDVATNAFRNRALAVVKEKAGLVKV